MKKEGTRYQYKLARHLQLTKNWLGIIQERKRQRVCTLPCLKDLSPPRLCNFSRNQRTSPSEVSGLNSVRTSWRKSHEEGVFLLLPRVREGGWKRNRRPRELLGRPVIGEIARVPVSASIVPHAAPFRESQVDPFGIRVAWRGLANRLHGNLLTK